MPEIDPGPTTSRRRYDSPVRRQQMAETRERIVAAGAEIVRELTSWDWSGLTFRGVAERAGVGVRTVYRHFPTERELRDGIMARLARDAGVDYERVGLGDVSDVAARVFRAWASFAARSDPSSPDDPTLVAVDEERRSALLRAVREAKADWSAQQQRVLAAALDLLWSPGAYERLLSPWGLGSEEAIQVIRWAVESLSAAPPDQECGGGEQGG